MKQAGCLTEVSTLYSITLLKAETAHCMNAGYEQSKLKAQDGKPLTEREREHNETTHSSPNLKPRGGKSRTNASFG